MCSRIKEVKNPVSIARTQYGESHDRPYLRKDILSKAKKKLNCVELFTNIKRLLASTKR